MYLIGISGRKGAGKDTAFTAIRSWAQQKGMLATRQGFADKLKLRGARVFFPDCTLEQALEFADSLKQGGENNKVVVTYETETGVQSIEVDGRVFWQREGTEAGRDVFGDSFWVDQVLPLGYVDPVLPKWWMNFDVDTIFACVTDVRFPNEAERVRELGGKVFEIHRGGESQDAHASEKPLPADLVDQTIYNSATIDIFKSTVKTVMDDLYGHVTGRPNNITMNILGGAK